LPYTNEEAKHVQELSSAVEERWKATIHSAPKASRRDYVISTSAQGDILAESCHCPDHEQND